MSSAQALGLVHISGEVYISRRIRMKRPVLAVEGRTETILRMMVQACGRAC